MQMSTTVFMTLTIVIGLLIYGVLRVGEMAFVYMIRMAQKLVVWVDDDSKSLRTQFIKTGGWISTPDGKKRLGANEFSTGKGPNTKVFRLEGAASYSGANRAWIVHPRHGWNMRAPNDEETVHADTFHAVLSIFDPAALYKAVARNEAADTLDRNVTKKEINWNVAFIVAGVIALAIVGMLVFLISKAQGAS
jgi:hypothetical protein